jgi:2-dehydro-3-deoxyphosphogluconate aldolase / (4S)-4-hydroxy-2-oxoglutarate aldolase
MTKEKMLATIEEIGIIPSVRVLSEADALFASEAVFRSGICVVEITMTVPGGAGVISRLARDYPEAIIGAGTVLDLDTARVCLDAGASFLTSTGLDPELVQFAQKHDIPLIPGALTPTEIMMARRTGAEFIKVFPCSNVGGPAYIKAMKRPFPNSRLIAAGGVSQQTAAEYIRAGANALGIGHELLPLEAIRVRNVNWINELARRFIGMVKEARNSKSTVFDKHSK